MTIPDVSCDYVKSVIESGDASGDLWEVFPHPSKAGHVTPYGVDGMSMPKAANHYIFNTNPNLVMAYPMTFQGSPLSTIYLTSIWVTMRGALDNIYIGNGAIPVTILLEIFRGEFSPLYGGSSGGLPGGTFAAGNEVALDSSSPSASLEIKINTTGVYNIENIFSGYFHLHYLAPAQVAMFNAPQGIKLNFGDMFGGPMKIEGQFQGVIIKPTFIVGTSSDLIGAYGASWYEI